jgi:hypothetical protein
MDRQIVYPGSIPLDTDLLNIQRHVMVSVGALARAVLGDGPVVDGMTCVPGATAYSVWIGPGSYSSLLPTDWSAFGSLPADPTQIVRTGLLTDTAIVTLGPPADGSHVIRWLVQATVTEADAGPVALPYWNAANPSVAFTGPGNSGQTQNTQRQLRVTVSAKPSGPEPIPPGASPDPDPGWVGLYTVTTYAGKTAIDVADIVPYWGTPRLRFKLPALPPGCSRQEVYQSSTQWQVPDGVHVLRVRLVGAGGGGGGGDAGFSGGGGGAGGYAESLLQVQPQQSFAIVVGTGGVAGATGASGGAGSGTSFGGGIVAATGGLGGGSANPDSHGGQPGAGSIGGLTQPGGYGSDGAVVASVPAGTGGASIFGGGGRGANQGGIPAGGIAAGSGGGGGYGAGSSGGQGASGLLIIEY